MEPALPDYVTKAKNDAQRMGQAANEFASASYTIPDELKKVVQEALDYNKDVVTGRAQSFSDYQRAPADANSRFGVQTFGTGEQAGQNNPNFIFNPFERNATISQYVSNQEVPFMMWNKLLGLREGSTADIVDAGTRAFGAQATAAQGRAQDARQGYTDAINQFQLLEDLKQRQFENSIKERELALKGSESGGLDSLLTMLGLGGSGLSGASSAKPMYTPKKNGEVSKDGAWKYDAKVKDWVSTGKAGGATSSLLSEFMTPETVASLIASDPKNSAKYTAIYKIAQDQKKTAGVDDAVQNINSALDTYLSEFKKTNIFSRANPWDPTGAELESFKNILTNVLAKEVENGRLTDADRQFYIDQMPAPWMSYNVAKAKVDGIKKGLTAKIGGQAVDNSGRPPIASFEY